jgi:hypothetical protein
MNVYNRQTQIRYYAVDRDLEYVEVADPKAVEKPNYLLVILKVTTTYITWVNESGYNNQDSTRDIEMLNSLLYPVEEFENNHWKFKISHLLGKGWHNNKDRFVVNYIDALEIDNKIEEFYIGPDGFVLAYKFLELSKYPGYKLAVLQVEKEKLSEENTLLKEELKLLKNEITRLKEKISYLA